MRVDLPDGRRLDVEVEGPEGGLPLVYHHGAPGAAVLYRPLVDAAARHGLRIVTYARPGYGRSDAAPGRVVADAARDTAAVLDALGLGDFVTVGWSGGGPHALACATVLAGRCMAAATLGGVAPYTAEGLDWTAGMGADNIEEFGAAVSGEPALTEYLRAQEEVLGRVTGAEVADALGDLVSEVDRRQLTGGFADYLAESFRIAVTAGIAGWRDDDLAFIRKWGFDLRGGCPVAVWQGDQDRMVPYAHGRWLAANVPGARAHLLPGHGHLSLFGLVDEVLDDLVAGRA
ncbi:alpha/beta fold hydrolase [Planosporangium thailandense]|nr:alpha/beta fold hydrolase [Planosporangium thailandense]